MVIGKGGLLTKGGDAYEMSFLMLPNESEITCNLVRITGGYIEDA